PPPRPSRPISSRPGSKRSHASRSRRAICCPWPHNRPSQSRRSPRWQSRSHMNTRSEGSLSVKSRLERSTTNRVIGGVCGGIAEYLAVDATLVRVVFVVTAFLTAGLGILAYIVLLVLMPQPGQPAPFTSSPPPATATDTTGSSELP